MKKIIKNSMTIIIFLQGILVHAQITNTTNTSGTTSPLTEYVGWDGLGGNSQNLDIANQFTPGATNYNINFWTNNSNATTQKMTILGTSGSDDGFVGVGVVAPVFKLTVGDPANDTEDGGILAVGTMGSGSTIPAGLTNNRMFWCPSRGVFRAGGSVLGEWDDSNMGDYSIGLGYGNNAWGKYSCTINKYTSATGEQAFAAGLSTNADADNSSAFGEFTRADSYDEMVIGKYNLPCVGCSSLSWQGRDPIFEIGNGTGLFGLENNIMTVLKDGRTGIGLLTFPTLADVTLNVEERTDAGLGSVNATAGYFKSTDTYSGGGQIIGVIGQAIQGGPTATGNSSGGRFFGGGKAKNTWGVYGWGMDATVLNYGGYFQATQAGAVNPTNFGVYAAALNATVNYAIYGDLGLACPPCPVPPCPPCAPPTTPNFAGYFNGDVGTTTAYWLLSDSSLKDNVQDISDPISILNQLNPKSYTYKQDNNQSMHLQPNTHFGLLAQELEGVLPQLVKESVHPARYDSLGNETYAAIDFKAVNYIELIPYLIAAIKQQQQDMESMQAQLATCCSSNERHGRTGGDGEEEGNSSTIDVELKNAKSIILNQNVPNPFAEQTIITYFLTDDVKKAQIFFYDNKGIILKMVDLNDKGAGQLNVYAADLSSGNYTYSLVADGKVVDTKKMVKTN